MSRKPKATTSANTVYAFCESVAAGPLSPWHIRPLTEVGRKTSGGIDTPSLCGHVTPKTNGWDLESVEVKNYPLDGVRDGRRLVCKKCADAYKALLKHRVVTIEELLADCARLMSEAHEIGRVSHDLQGAYLKVRTDQYHFELIVRVRVRLETGKPAIHAEPLFHVHHADAASSKNLTDYINAQQRALACMTAIEALLAGIGTINPAR